jgi:hypothetical protein
MRMPARSADAIVMRDPRTRVARRQELQAASAALRRTLTADVARVGERARLIGRIASIARSSTARRLLGLVVRMAVSRRRRRAVGWFARLVSVYPLLKPLLARLLRRH